MPLQIRRTTESFISTSTLANGEPVFSTDTHKLFIGDGVTPGGFEIGAMAASTSTYYNLTATNKLTVGPDDGLGQLTIARVGTNQQTISTTNSNEDYIDINDFRWINLNPNDTGGSAAVIINEGVPSRSRLRVNEITPTSGQTSINFTNRLVFNTATNYIETATDGTYYSMVVKAKSGIGLDPGAGQLVSITGAGIEVDTIRNNDAGFITISDPTTFSQTATVATIKFGDNTTMVSANTSTLWSGASRAYLDGTAFVAQKFFAAQTGVALSGNGYSFQNESYSDTGMFSRADGDLQFFTDNVRQIQLSVTTGTVVSNTLTVGGMTIGLNNDAVVMPAATVVSSATTVLFQTNPTSGGNIIFNMNRFGVAYPLAITRTGGIAFSHGQQITPGQGANLGSLNVQAGSTATGTANQLFLSSGGSGTGPLARGVFNDGTGFTIGTRTSGGATAFNSSVFDLNGGLTLPKSLVVGTTATVAGLVLGSDPVITSRAELIGPTGPQGPSGQSSSIYDYKANTGATSGDPGSGFVLWNNATQASATELVFSHINDNGDDIEYLLAFLAVGDVIRLQDQTNSENNQIWTITSPVVVTTGSYVTVPVSLSTSTHSFGNNNVLGVIIRTAGVVGPTGGVGPTGPAGPGADQSLDTTSSVTFANANVTTRIDASQIYANATTQDLTLTAAFNGSGSGAGGSVNIFSAGGVQAAANVEILGDLVKIKSSDGTVDVATFDPFGITSTINSTLTIAAASIGLNNDARAFGNGYYPSNANNMKIENPNNGAGFNFAMKTGAGAERNVGISRTGNVVLANGVLGNGFPNGVGLSSQDGGAVNISAVFDDGVTSPASIILASTQTGITLNTSVYDYATDTAVNYDATLGLDGVFTVPTLAVTTTASVAALKIGTDTVITSRAELIGPTGPAGSAGAAGPTGPAGGYSGTEQVFALGNTSGTLAVDATSATIFTMTLTGNLTMNAITNVVTGTNATFVITQDGTGGRTLTSSWKFAGGAKTLTTSATATDMISVFYDGSTYYASLSRGFV